MAPTGRNDGFVPALDGAATPMPTRLAMGYWTEQDLPFYYGLARTFPLADHWFSSCLGPTFPNRRFLIAGTAHGLIDDLPCDLLDYPPRRDHLRHADQARDLLGQLPPRARDQRLWPAVRARPRRMARAPAAGAASAAHAR